MQLITARGQRLMGLLVLARIWTVRLAYTAFRLLPQRRLVVLATAHLDRPAGNLVAIRDELAARRPAIRTRVLAYRSRPGLAGALSGFSNAIVAAYLLAVAAVFIVDDYFFPIYVIAPRPGSLIIQVWHACGAFKKFGHSVGEGTFASNPALAARVNTHSNYDICLASSRETAEFYAEAFGQPLERFDWETGIPRTDILIAEPEASQRRESLRRSLGIPGDKRAILYAPTFRGDRTYDARSPGNLDLQVLRDTLADDHVLLIRLHPFVRPAASQARQLAGFVIDVSHYADINELMLASDVLITDYSSVIFEFALLGRPVALFAPDHEEYQRERGYYFDYRAEGPGPVFESAEELAGYLRRGEFDLERVARFRERWFSVADGKASRRFVDRLVLPALDDRRRRRLS